MKRTLIVCGLILIGYAIPDKDTLTARALHAEQDACSHPISPQVWAIMTPNQRKFQQKADSFTHNFIRAVFGTGPYPKCLYQSVRDYFIPVAGATPAEEDLADRRREDAAVLMHTILSSRE